MPGKYEEGMPITSVIDVKGSILVGGGGGNKLYGFPNKLFLLDTEMNVLDNLLVKKAVFSTKCYENFVIVEYEDCTFEIFEIDNGKITGPHSFPEGARSPVLFDGMSLYVKDNGIWSISLLGLIEGNTNKEAQFSRQPERGDELVALLVKGENLLVLVKRKEGFLLLDREFTAALSGPISDYTNVREFGYIVQMKKEMSYVCMEGAVKTHAIEPKCTTVNSLGDGAFLLGDGDGCLIKYKNGRKAWKTRVFKNSPVSSIGSIGSSLYCSSINGRLVKVDSREGMDLKRVAFGMFIGLGVLCAAYFAS